MTSAFFRITIFIEKILYVEGKQKNMFISKMGMNTFDLSPVFSSTSNTYKCILFYLQKACVHATSQYDSINYYINIIYKSINILHMSFIIDYIINL